MLPIEHIADRYGSSMAVVIQACRVYFETATIEELQLLTDQHPINWQQVGLLSRLHRIRPVVYKSLLNCEIPEQFKTSWLRELQLNTIQNFELAAETERIINLLGGSGIVALPYKGVAFAQQFYGDISMRETGDIDLVVKPEDLDKCYHILEQEDYIPHNKALFLSTNRKKFLQKQKDLCFDKTSANGTCLHVELHWKITHPIFGVPTSLNFFDTTQRPNNKFLSAEIPFLSFEEHFRALALHHLAQDGLEYLKIIVDLSAGLINLKDRSPNVLSSLDRHFHGSIIPTICSSLFGIDHSFAPPLVKEQEKLTNQFLRFLLNSTIGRYKRHKLLSLTFHYWRQIHNRAALKRSHTDRLRYKVFFLLFLISPQLSDRQSVRLPWFLGWAYALIRPVRILMRNK